MAAAAYAPRYQSPGDMPVWIQFGVYTLVLVSVLLLPVVKVQLNLIMDGYDYNINGAKKDTTFIAWPIIWESIGRLLCWMLGLAGLIFGVVQNNSVLTVFSILGLSGFCLRMLVNYLCHCSVVYDDNFRRMHKEKGDDPMELSSNHLSISSGQSVIAPLPTGPCGASAPSVLQLSEQLSAPILSASSDQQLNRYVEA